MIKTIDQEEPRTKNQDEQGGTRSQELKENEHDQDHDPKQLKGTKSYNQRRTNMIKIVNQEEPLGTRNQEVEEDEHNQGHEPVK